MLNRLFHVMALSLLTLNLVGCAKPVPKDLVSTIEQQLNKHSEKEFNLGFVTLFDSDNKKTKFLARESEPDKEVENEFFLRPKEINENTLKDSASEIKELSTITVLGLSGIKVNDTTYDYCKYITIDNQSHPDLAELVCKINENQEKEKNDLSIKNLKVLDPKFVKELSEVAKIKNIGLIVLNDYKTGQPELFLAKDNYVSPDVKVDFPLLLARDAKEKNNEKMTITSLNTWTVITYRQNPCKSCATSGGTGDCTRVKDSSC
ncbi:hypothetical protein [Nitrosomonas sp.]|uniref:hypothetical protein n=1 Tax=Nitrosomonas sp. TaxID=42353 RepID=UPI0025F3ED65|nr:hypothetical protein [Nitrosomonas sp.]MBS0587326.1 hypothetical protein [Pseudomonadota bacterium]MBV6449187.1 hypothetical protein [Nitrosomonas sp.]